MRTALLLLPAALALAAPARAQAPPRPRVVLRLDYDRGPGTRCPDEHAATELLRAEVSYDASPDAELRLAVEATRQGGEHRVSATLRDGTGATLWTLQHRSPDCADALESCMVSTALRLGEVRWAREERERAAAAAAVAVPAPLPVVAAPVAAPVVAPVIAVPPAPAAPPPKRKVEMHGGVDVVFNPVVAPSVSLGFAPSVGVLLREPGISIDLGLRAMSTLKATKAINGDAFGWTYASGVLAASVHRSFLFGGLVLEAGTLSPRSDHGLVRNTVAPGFFAAGFRGGVQRSFDELVTLRASVEGEYLPVAAHVVNTREPGSVLWAMPSLSATVAAGLTFNVW